MVAALEVKNYLSQVGSRQPHLVVLPRESAGIQCASLQLMGGIEIMRPSNEEWNKDTKS